MQVTALSKIFVVGQENSQGKELTQISLHFLQVELSDLFSERGLKMSLVE